MATDSKIEWTTHTWNPFYGCPDDGRRSPACENCYARSWARRSGIVDFDREVKRAKDATFYAPVRGQKYRPGDRVFVCSLSDICHPDVPKRALFETVAVMLERPDLTWMLLTKRPDRFDELLKIIRYCWSHRPVVEFPPNWWLGVTVENQAQAARILYLLEIPATVRFVSCEPLLEAVDLSRWMTMMNYYLGQCASCGWIGSTQQALGNADDECLCPACYKDLDGLADDGLSWVIAGGESGPRARPMHPDWARSLRNQCAAADVPFFFKQWGEWCPESFATAHKPNACACGNPPVVRVGKKKAGRKLDTVEHNAAPAADGEEV